MFGVELADQVLDEGGFAHPGRTGEGQGFGQGKHGKGVGERALLEFAKERGIEGAGVSERVALGN